MVMEACDALEILSLFERANIDVWVEGGWGVDALLGSQMRDHGDLDLIVDAPRSELAKARLCDAGFEVIFEDPPGRTAYQDARGREVDLCIAAADRYGDRWCTNRSVGRGEPDYPLECFTTGWIGGKSVACVGPETQIRHHQGYEPEDVDRHDLGLLRERFDVAIPDALR